MPDLPALDPREAVGIPPEALPRHIAIIMDGNGRWACQRGLERVAGHREGANSVREIVTTCARLGIECLTLYSFSRENWKRSPEEVGALMSLYAELLVAERDVITRNDVRLVQLGRRTELPAEVLRELDVTQSVSHSNRRLTLCLALNYSSRTEIVDAVQAIARRVVKGELRPDDIDEDTISNSLYTAGLPDPDLLIRTAGEMRVSNFLLWQISYAELYVTPVLWPDFRRDELFAALRAYAQRERRFGGVLPTPGSETAHPTGT